MFFHVFSSRASIQAPEFLQQLRLPTWPGKRAAVWLIHSCDHQSGLACVQ